MDSRDRPRDIQERLVSVKRSSMMVVFCVDVKAGGLCGYETRTDTPMGLHGDILFECNEVIYLSAQLDVTRCRNNPETFQWFIRFSQELV